MPKSPPELLIEALKARKMTKSELGRRCGVKFGYQAAHAWTRGVHFSAKNQRLAAKALGLPLDYFELPDLAAARREHVAAVFAEFVATELGRTATDAERAVLESVPFDRVRLIAPTVRLYQAWLLALRGHGESFPGQLEDVK